MQDTTGEDAPKSEGLDPEFLEFLHHADTKLEDNYAEELKISDGDKAMTLSLEALQGLPPGERYERIQRLRMKMEQYTLRLQNAWTGRNEYLAPELIFSDDYSRDVLRMLLEKGRINTWSLSRALEKRDTVFNGEEFERACGVVNDYVSTGGKNAMSPSGGLPNLPNRK